MPEGGKKAKTLRILSSWSSFLRGFYVSTEPVNLQSEFAICDRRAFGRAAREVGRLGADHRHASTRHRQSVMLICEDRLQAGIVRGGDAVAQRDDRQLDRLRRVDEFDAVIVDVDPRHSDALAPVAVDERVGQGFDDAWAVVSGAALQEGVFFDLLLPGFARRAGVPKIDVPIDKAQGAVEEAKEIALQN